MDIWATVGEERASILQTFEGLSPEQWRVPSLCGHWTVRQVLGRVVALCVPSVGPQPGRCGSA